MKPVKTILILGGGSAGLITALSLRRLAPDIEVELVRSTEIGVIGVGEGTTPAFPALFFDTLNLPKDEFYRETQPTWKHGIKFLWGPRDHFYYTFDFQYDEKREGMPMANGFYAGAGCESLSLAAALVDSGKAFPTGPLGRPVIGGGYAFHIENERLVEYLEKVCAENGVKICDDTFEEAVRDGDTITELRFRSGAVRTGDLIIDASGFRSELIGRELDVPMRDFSDNLLCDRAWIGGWSRTDEPLHAYTTAETMDSGWCWQIEHENWINRGYVFASDFISDEDALAEFLRKNPKVSNEPRLVKFRSGRRELGWVGNVIAVGNSSGFVEPLEATALAQLIYEVHRLLIVLRKTAGVPDEQGRDYYNMMVGRAWDEIHDFLAYHYRFNTRLDTPFWKQCVNETKLGGFEGLYQEYRRIGPSPELIHALPYQPNIFGLEGYLAMLVGMNVPHQCGHQPSDNELVRWQRHQRAMRTRASAGVDSVAALAAIRSPQWSWS